MAKIMIVDDAAFMRTHLKNILLKAGHEIIAEAEDGQEAITKYKEIDPELVTMDITMPIMGGIEAVKRIIEYDSKAIILMCSAMGQKVMILNAIEAGAKHFIVKPFQEENVIKTISEFLN